MSSLCHVLRSGDVLIVRDTAVFVHLHKEIVVHGLHLVLLADVAGEDSRVEMRSGLVLVVTASVQVIDIEAEGQALVGIDGEVGLEALLAVELVARLVVSQIGVGHVAVGELKVTRREVEARHGFKEQRMRPRLPV